MIAPRACATAGLCTLVAALGCTLDMSQKHSCRTNADCVGDRICIVETCRPAKPPDGEPQNPNYAFVTSSPVPIGQLSLDTADGICNASAAALPSPGLFRAWLSTSAVDARDRLQGARGWVRADGTPFADTVDDIEQGRIFNPLSIDEHGLTLSPVAVVVTGTLADGRLEANMNCGDWNGDASGNATAGTTDGTTGVWTRSTTVPCGGQARLYCFGVDHVATVAPAPPPGKLAFLSNDPFSIGGGLAAADSHCQREATAAGLSGTFRALLASDGVPAASRVQVNASVVWWRLDGVRLNADASATFLDAATLLAPLNVTSRMNYMDASVFTGAGQPTDAGAAAQTCADWMSTAASLALMGRASSRQQWFTTGGAQPCDRPAVDLYCFQSD